MAMATTEDNGRNPSGNPQQPPTRDLIEAHRHAELVEALWRVNTALEAIHRLLERQLRATAGMEAKFESTLQYVVRAWQDLRGGVREGRL